MTDNIVYIPKYKISPLLIEHISNPNVLRFKKLKNDFLLFEKIIPVEKDPTQDQYYLVGRYPTFQLLYKEEDLVPCLVEPYTNRTQQLTKIARRFLYQTPSKPTKEKIIDELYRSKLTKKEIIRFTAFQREQVNNFTYNVNIPEDIKSANEVQGRPVPIATLNEINKLQRAFPEELTDDITNELYKKAQTKTLTQEQLKVILKMLRKTERFQLLTL